MCFEIKIIFLPTPWIFIYGTELLIILQIENKKVLDNTINRIIKDEIIYSVVPPWFMVQPYTLQDTIISLTTDVGHHVTGY